MPFKQERMLKLIDEYAELLQYSNQLILDAGIWFDLQRMRGNPETTGLDLVRHLNSIHKPHKDQFVAESVHFRRFEKYNRKRAEKIAIKRAGEDADTVLTQRMMSPAELEKVMAGQHRFTKTVDPTLPTYSADDLEQIAMMEEIKNRNNFRPASNIPPLSPPPETSPDEYDGTIVPEVDI